VVVENSGEGAHWAAPIASFIVEKYLKGSISQRESGITVDYYANATRLPDSATYLHSNSFNRRKALKADSIKKRVQDSVNRKLKGAKSAAAKNKKDSSTRFLAAQPMHKEDE
jgi:penicillin-binding protein 2